MDNRIISLFIYLFCLCLFPILKGSEQSVKIEVGLDLPALPPALQPFDLNGDGVIDQREEELMRQALGNYFKDKKVDMSKIEKHLKKRADVIKRDSPERMARVASAEDSPNGGSSSDSSNQLQEMILHAVSDSLAELQEEKDKTEKNSVQKKKAYGATIVTALGGVASTLLMKYLSYSCECDK